MSLPTSNACTRCTRVHYDLDLPNGQSLRLSSLTANLANGYFERTPLFGVPPKDRLLASASQSTVRTVCAARCSVCASDCVRAGQRVVCAGARGCVTVEANLRL